MEPPSVTSTSNGTEKPRRQNTADYLQIDPSSTFINNTARNGGFEELPENFLDTISPHPTTPHSSGSGGVASAESPTPTPQLAPLAPMSISNEQPSSSYSGMLSTQYSHLDKPTFSNSPAGLLSPLQLDRRQRGSHEFIISSGNSSQGYIKEEVDLDGSGVVGGHLLIPSSLHNQQQEMERIAQAETPPAVSNVELASTMIASLIGGDSSSALQSDDSPESHVYSDQVLQQQQQQIVKDESEDDPSSMSFHTSHKVVHSKRGLPTSHSTISNGEGHELDFQSKHVYTRSIMNQTASSSTQMGQTQPFRRVYSTQDSNDPLNAEIDDDIYIDTKDLCKRIAFELKQHSIPQAVFAERILCRSQGTLSDLLRNPKPWNKLKSGRETFRRMYNWVRQPLATRLAILDMKSEGDSDVLSRVSGLSPPTPAQNVRQQRKSSSDPDAPSSKRPRLVFTDIQKRTLQAIFKETQRPSREMQQTIAEHLRLDLSTVANFFMNARRRSRIGPSSEETTPYPQMDMPVNGAIGSGTEYEHDMEDEQRHGDATVPSSTQSPEKSEDVENGEIKAEEAVVKEETPDDEDYERLRQVETV